MTRDVFLKELRIALQGHIPQAQVNEQLQYYENYIMEESRKGHTQEQVILDLGNPRLIAKTLIAACAESNREEENKESKKRKKPWHMRILSAVIFIVFFILVLRAGIFLLPVLAVLCMVGAIAGILYLIFYGNKK